MPCRVIRDCLRLQLANCAFAKSAPVSWVFGSILPKKKQFVRDAIAEHIGELPHTSVKMYSIAELMDLAESNNPETRVG